MEYNGFMGYQCLPSEGVCIPVAAMTTYDQNFPLYNTVQQCQSVCGGYYAGGPSQGGDLDVEPGPKKAPKSFSD